MVETKKDLGYYLNLQYEIKVCKKGDIFVLSIPELGIVKKAADLKNGFEEIETAKNKFLKELVEEGFQDWIEAHLPTAGGASTKSGDVPLTRNLASFAIKFFIVIATLLLVASFLTQKADDYSLGKSAPSLPEITDRVKGAAKKELEAIPEWPDEKVERYRLLTRDICRRLKPIINEIKIVWEEE